MKVTSNKDMVNAIRKEASDEFKNHIPVMESDEMARKVPDKLEGYPTIKNEFIQTLINKVVRTDFFSRIYNNPLKMLKKGSLAYGASIEELFVLAAEAKGFFGDSSHFGDSSTVENVNQPKPEELLKIKQPDVKALYITKNFAYFFQTSISDAQLKAAFTSANGLSELVNQIVGSLTNGAEQTEYKDMINLLNAAAQNKRVITDGKGKIRPVTDRTITASAADGEPIPTTLTADTEITSKAVKRSKNGVLQTMHKHEVKFLPTDKWGKQLSIAVRSLAGRMKFVNSRYNMAGVDTFCNPEDLVFLTTPEILAEMDVDVLSEAFNVSKAELNVRTIVVDELPTVWKQGKKASTPGDAKDDSIGYYTSAQNGDAMIKLSGGQECLGILMDKNFIQAIDTLNEARQFDNGRTLTNNMLLHRQGILDNCYFSNCVALFNTAGYGAVQPK